MSPIASLLIYLSVGCIGGLIGLYARLPSGVLLGAALAVIAFKFWINVSWQTPRFYGFACQVMLGVLIALTYTPGMFKTAGRLLIPMGLSTLALTVCGAVVALIIVKWWPMDLPNAYIATSPGALSALLPFAVDAKINAALIGCFHFVRVFFILLTAPFVFKFLLK